VRAFSSSAPSIPRTTHPLPFSLGLSLAVFSRAALSGSSRTVIARSCTAHVVCMSAAITGAANPNPHPAMFKSVPAIYRDCLKLINHVAGRTAKGDHTLRALCQVKMTLTRICARRFCSRVGTTNIQNEQNRDRPRAHQGGTKHH
jgi:hypothetical protein